MPSAGSTTVTKNGKKRIDVAILFALCGVLFSILIFIFMLKQEREAAIQQFQGEMAQQVVSFQQNLISGFYLLERLQLALQVGGSVEAGELKQLLQGQNANSSVITAVMVVPPSESPLIYQGVEAIAQSKEFKQLISQPLASQQVEIQPIYSQKSASVVLAAATDNQYRIAVAVSIEGALVESPLNTLIEQGGISLAYAEDQQIWNSVSGNIASDATYSTALLLPEGEWLLTLTATEEWLSSRMSFTPAMFLLTGLLLSFLMASYLQRITKHLKYLKNEQAALSAQVEGSSWNDPLTGLVNRIHFDETLDIECRRAVRDFSPLTLMLLRVDHYQLYCETYGVDAAEQLLQRLSHRFKESVARPGDMIARLDDHLFGFILPSTNELVSVLAERCCDDVRQLQIEHSSSPQSDCVTISIGVATLQPNQLLTAERLFSEADKQLDKVVTAGGDHYMAFSEEITEPSQTYAV